jgi:hypothetical protein
MYTSFMASTCTKFTISPAENYLFVAAEILNCLSKIKAITAFVDLKPVIFWYKVRCSLIK